MREPYRIERKRRLRAHDFDLWDPIGLLGAGEIWEGKPFCDEYDSYLDGVVARLHRKQPEEDIVAWLLWVEAEQMGLTTDPGAQERARDLVRAIANDSRLSELPGI